MNTCDIIIPTYNNSQTLFLALESLSRQHIPKNWQVKIIVVDDGSLSPVVLPATRQDFSTSVVHQAHQGSATARNRGIKKSNADIIVLLGSDILLRPGALAQHLVFHEEHRGEKHAALGMVKWDPRLRPTPFMEWMTHGGPQNDFDSLLGIKTAQAKNYFYGSHISIKRSMFTKTLFPTEYKGYGWEDLDVGCTLESKGLRLSVLHGAIGLHHHKYTAKKIYGRQRAAGQSMKIFQLRHGSKVEFPTLSRRAGWKLVFYRMPGVRHSVQVLVRTIGMQMSIPKVFEAITTAEFWLGVENSGKLYDK